jgi:hypothetical protein
VGSDEHDDKCGTEGTTFRGTRITRAKIDLINELLRDHQLPECVQLNDDDWTCA